MKGVRFEMQHVFLQLSFFVVFDIIVKNIGALSYKKHSGKSYMAEGRVR